MSTEQSLTPKKPSLHSSHRSTAPRVANGGSDPLRPEHASTASTPLEQDLGSWGQGPRYWVFPSPWRRWICGCICGCGAGWTGFPGSASAKELTCQCRGCKRCCFDPWVRKSPWRRAWQPTLVFLPGESHGQRSLGSYSPWGCKGSVTTEAA